MTRPTERANAVIRTRQFLTALSTPYGGGIKGVRKDLRAQARALLRHYPSMWEIRMAGEKAPDLFAVEDDDEREGYRGGAGAAPEGDRCDQGSPCCDAHCNNEGGDE
jgi:hypothetical protein